MAVAAPAVEGAVGLDGAGVGGAGGQGAAPLGPVGGGGDLRVLEDLDAQVVEEGGNGFRAVEGFDTGSGVPAGRIPARDLPTKGSMSCLSGAAPCTSSII